MERYLNCYITEISNLRRRRVAMATFMVMDMNGDTRLEFNGADARQLLEAEGRFKELIGAGFTAAARKSVGELELTRMFDQLLIRSYFFPVSSADRF